MSITLEGFQQATGIQALQANDRGQVRFKPGLTLTDRKRFLKRAVAVYRKAEKDWRFFLGDMINDLRLPYGQKKGYCRDTFGEHQGNTFYGFSLTAAHWDDDSREYSVSWSLYKESGPMPEDARLSIIRQVERRELKPEQALQACQEWKRANTPTGSTGASFDLETAPKPAETGSTITISNTTILEPLFKALQCIQNVQGLDALQALIDARRTELQDEFADSEEE